MDINSFNNKKYIALFASFLMLFLAYGSYSALIRASKTEVTFTVAPSVSQLYIDGVQVHTGKQYISRKQHKIEAKLDGFSTYSQSVTITKSDKMINILLNPITNKARIFLDANPDFQLERERLGGVQFSEGSQHINNKYSFISSLPLERQRFTVNYGDPQRTKKKNGDPAIALYVSVTDPSEKRNALRTVSEELGIEPADIEIIFENYTNPFGSGSSDVTN